MLTNTDLELAKLKLLGFKCKPISYDGVMLCMKDNFEALIIPDTVKSIIYDSTLKISKKLAEYDGKDVALKVCGGKSLESTSELFDSTEFNTIDLSEFDTSNVEDMSGMFYFCKVENLNISSLNTSNVIDMSFMFSGCHTNELDLRNFNTDDVWDMSGMFRFSNIHKLDLSTLKVDKLRFAYDMFLGCASNSIIINKGAFDIINSNDYDAENIRNIGNSVFNIIDN